MSPVYPPKITKASKPLALVLMGFLYADQGECENVLGKMEPMVGSPLCRGEKRPFDYTDYYAAEMGGSLKREYMAFERLISPEHLVELKHETAQIEALLASNGKRVVNIDPGYVDINKVVLASWKEGLYKVYLGDGVWADPVAHYFEKGFHCEEWTFPDILSGEHFSFFREARLFYKKMMKKRREGETVAYYTPPKTMR